MQQLTNILQQLARNSNDRQVIRHSIGLLQRLQELNPQNYTCIHKNCFNVVEDEAEECKECYEKNLI